MANIYIASPLCDVNEIHIMGSNQQGSQNAIKIRTEMRMNSRQILKDQPDGVWLIRYSSYNNFIDDYVFRRMDGSIIDSGSIKCFYALDYMKVSKSSRKIKHDLIMESKLGFTSPETLFNLRPNTIHLNIETVYSSLNDLITARGLDLNKQYLNL